MRGLLGGYLAIGIIFLLIGFFATGPCQEQNRDVVSDTVFVLGWPVYLYGHVVQGDATAPQWLHQQACGGGVVTFGDDPSRRPSGGSMAPRESAASGSDR